MYLCDVASVWDERGSYAVASAKFGEEELCSTVCAEGLQPARVTKLRSGNMFMTRT